LHADDAEGEEEMFSADHPGYRANVRLAGATIVGVSMLVACSTTPGVEVEYRSDSAARAGSTTTTTTNTSSTTTSSTTTTIPLQPPNDPAPPRAGDSVLFDLADFDIEVSLRPTSAPTPPGGYDGFHTVVQLDDGSLMASGFDSPSEDFQPERSALWHTADGENWERVGRDDISLLPDQQSISSLTATNGGVRADGMLLDTSGPVPRVDSAVFWSTSDRGDSWLTTPTTSAALVERALRIDDRVVTVGSGNVNEPGSFFGQVTVHEPGSTVEPQPVDIDVDGNPITGSIVLDLIALDDEWLAVGATTLTDLGRRGDEVIFDSSTLGFPSDVAIWSSSDAGGSWKRLEINRFAGEGGTQAGVQLADDGARRWMLVSAQKFGVFALDLLTSTDGRSWALHPYRRTPEPDAGDLANAGGVYFVEGAIVVIDEVLSVDGPSLVMSVIDPATDEIVSHDLTDELGGVHQIEDVVQLDGLALGVGRVERGENASDLQTIEVRRVEPDEEPEPLPTTTTPSAGGASDARSQAPLRSSGEGGAGGGEPGACPGLASDGVSDVRFDRFVLQRALVTFERFLGASHVDVRDEFGDIGEQ